jgi:anti-anti-sigma regulatory factor
MRRQRKKEHPKLRGGALDTAVVLRMFLKTMEVTTDESGHTMLLSGALCIDTAQELRAALRHQLQGEGPVVLNLSNVTECDAAALQLLISARKTAEAVGRVLEFSGVSEQIRAHSAGLGLPLFDTATQEGVHAAE